MWNNLFRKKCFQTSRNCLPKNKITTGLHERNSDGNDSKNEEVPDDEISYIDNKKVLKGTFDNLKKIKVEKIPFDIDGKKVYQVTAQKRTKLLKKLKDGRQWKKDSRTTSSDFKEVRYRDCYVGLQVNILMFLE